MNSSDFEEMRDDEMRTAKMLGCVLIVTMVAIVIACILIIGSFKKSYNNLVLLNEDVEAATSDIETQLQGRLELIPDLVATVQAKAQHEESIIEAIADARSNLSLATEDLQSALYSGDLETALDANELLTTAISDFKVVVENYPDLASDTEYSTLMYQIEGAVNRIRVARENYTKAVKAYNSKIKSFPTVIVASMFGFEEKSYIEATDSAHQNNVVEFDNK